MFYSSLTFWLCWKGSQDVCIFFLIYKNVIIALGLSLSKEVYSSAIDSIKTLRFSSDSDSPPELALALKPAMSPEWLNPKPPLPDLHVLFSIREYHPLQISRTLCNSPSWPFTDEPPVYPSNGAHLGFMTEGPRFGIHYSTVAGWGLKYTWCAIGISWVYNWINV